MVQLVKLNFFNIGIICMKKKISVGFMKFFLGLVSLKFCEVFQKNV